MQGIRTEIVGQTDGRTEDRNKINEISTGITATNNTQTQTH